MVGILTEPTQLHTLQPMVQASHLCEQVNIASQKAPTNQKESTLLHTLHPRHMGGPFSAGLSRLTVSEPESLKANFLPSSTNRARIASIGSE